MNPAALGFLVLAVGCMAGWVILAALTGHVAFDGLSLLGSTFAILAITAQILLRKAHR